jgi:hypothetical protein
MTHNAHPCPNCGYCPHCGRADSAPIRRNPTRMSPTTTPTWPTSSTAADPLPYFPYWGWTQA